MPEPIILKRLHIGHSIKHLQTPDRTLPASPAGLIDDGVFCAHCFYEGCIPFAEIDFIDRQTGWSLCLFSFLHVNFVKHRSP